MSSEQISWGSCWDLCNQNGKVLTRTTVENGLPDALDAVRTLTDFLTKIVQMRRVFEACPNAPVGDRNKERTMAHLLGLSRNGVYARLKFLGCSRDDIVHVLDKDLDPVLLRNPVLGGIIADVRAYVDAYVQQHRDLQWPRIEHVAPSVRIVPIDSLSFV
jgi:hypothetical protein